MSFDDILSPEATDSPDTTGVEMTADSSLVMSEVAPIAAKPRRKRPVKAKIANAPCQKVLLPAEIIDRLQEQNQQAEKALCDLSAVWLNTAATRRRSDAAIALKHYDAALDMLRKACHDQRE